MVQEERLMCTDRMVTLCQTEFKKTTLGVSGLLKNNFTAIVTPRRPERTEQGE